MTSKHKDLTSQHKDLTRRHKDLTSQHNYLTSDGRSMPPYIPDIDQKGKSHVRIPLQIHY